MAFAAPALVGAALMLALRSKATKQAPVASDAELVA
jgi:AAHS family benzoate transporter-like MFS transporter